MRLILFIITLANLLASCQFNKDTPSEISNDSVQAVESGLSKIVDTVDADSSEKNPQILALTANALQLVDLRSGSTREISFGMPFNQLVRIVSRVVNSEPSSVGVNTDCGAGPLKMARWSNGLSLVFVETKQGDSAWLFAGWFIDKPKKLTRRS
jgi:hypothetical protein